MSREWELPAVRSLRGAGLVLLLACGLAAASGAAAIYDYTHLFGPADAHAQMMQSGGFGDSPFERDFGDIKFLDAYFGRPNEKIEVEPGDSHVPFTVVFANVGTQDITGIRGQLSMPFGFGPSAGYGPLIHADSDTNSMAGDSFSLTFFVNIEGGADIRQYPAAVKVDYSRLRESGVRTAFANFEFIVTGDTMVNISAVAPFLTSLSKNEAVIRVANDGTAPLAGVEITAANTQTERVSTAASTTNVENVVMSESSWDLGQIEPGSHALITSEIYVPESLRGETLRIPLDISYYNAHGDRILLSKIVDFYIRGLIDLDVFNVGVIDISGRPMIIGEIINEGNEDGLFGFVSVSPLGSSNLRAASQFIDEIEVDAPVPFNIPVEFDGEPRYGEHEIRIDVRYKDGIREEKILQTDAMIYIEAPPPPEKNPLDLSTLAGDGEASTMVADAMDGSASVIFVGAAVAVAVAVAAVIVRHRVRRADAGDDSQDSNFASIIDDEQR